MYRRYSQTNGTTATLSQMKRSRLKDLLILVLLGLLIAALVIGIQALQKDRNARSVYIRRIQTECDEAVRQVATLSRNAGADSASILSRIRSNLYAIQVISGLQVSQGSGALVSEDRILTLQNTVDRYMTYLTTGMDTGEYQTTLQNALEELQEAVMTLN
ncbi:MAG: hypothetical protein IKH81_00115 [Clostridia bacterium]|nr:hypothetical protein [Clostridia bacterium]